jgi:hypothetical protein
LQINLQEAQQKRHCYGRRTYFDRRLGQSIRQAEADTLQGRQKARHRNKEVGPRQQPWPISLAAYVTSHDARRIHLELATPDDACPEEGASDVYLPTQQGVFYLLQLEPAHDPGRFKVGFATNLSERLRTLRCSAPFANVVRSWKCKFLWEKTAIDCVTDGCERLHTEVFRTNSINSVVARCEQFFEIMPKLV